MKTSKSRQLENSATDSARLLSSRAAKVASLIKAGHPKAADSFFMLDVVKASDELGCLLGDLMHAIALEEDEENE